MTRRVPLLVVVAYGAGIAAGLAHFWAPAGIAALVMSTWGRGTQSHLGLAGMVVLLGVGAGALVEARATQTCSTRLQPGRQELSLLVNDPAPIEGALISVGPRGGWCRGAVSARWPAGRPVAAGMVVAVEATWSRPLDSTRRGRLAVHQVGVVSGTPGPAARLRTLILAGIERLYGDRAPLVEALVLNRKQRLDPDLRDTFASAGLMHLLAISGFHIGLVTLWLYLGARLCRLGRTAALIVASSAALGYAAFLGWPAAATRAALMATIVVVSRIRQRQVDSGALLATTSLGFLLLDPRALVDVGAWLSIAAITGLTTLGRWSRLRVGRQAMVQALAGSVGASVWVAPITAAVFGVVSLAGIALNLLAIPLAALALPAVFASLATVFLVPPLAEALATSAGAVLSGIEYLARIGAGIPGGHVTRIPGVSAAIPWLVLLAAVWWAVAGRATVWRAIRRLAWVAAVSALVQLAVTLKVPARPAELTLHFLDVGQGDGVVLRTPRGRWVVIDAGPSWGRNDAGRQVVAPFLDRHGARRLTAAILSHADADHLGGMPAVLRRFPAQLVIEPGAVTDSPLYLAFLDAMLTEEIGWRAGRAGDKITVDGVDLTVLHPDTSWSGWGDRLNEDSVVLLVEHRGFRALLTGDIGFPAEQFLQGRVGRIDLLKVAHHGSRGSSGDRWLEELRPAVALVSVGRNRYGHPAPQALSRLARSGAALWRTDQEGHIQVSSDGGTVVVESRQRRHTYAVGSSDQ